MKRLYVQARFEALVGLQKTLWTGPGRRRMVRRTPAVREVLELTRLHRIPELVRI